jgi:hypothetical protein
MLNTCPQGHDNPDTAQFCNTCGTPLTQSPHEGALTAARLPMSKPRPRWLIPVAVIVSIALITGLTIIIATLTTPPRDQWIPNALTACNVDETIDTVSGRQIMSMNAEDPRPGSKPTTGESIGCVLRELRAPQSVRTEIAKTLERGSEDPENSRAEWGDFLAFWYHTNTYGFGITIMLKLG